MASEKVCTECGKHCVPAQSYCPKCGSALPAATPSLATASDSLYKLILNNGGEEEIREFEDLEQAMNAALPWVLKGYIARIMDQHGVVKYTQALSGGQIATDPASDPRPTVPRGDSQDNAIRQGEPPRNTESADKQIEEMEKGRASAAVPAELAVVRAELTATMTLQELISSLAMNMLIVGTVPLLAGFLLLGVGLFFVFKKGELLPLIALMVGGAITMLIGGFTVQAGRAFLRIGRSSQITVGNLTKAIKDLRDLYRLQKFIILGFALAFALICAFVALTKPGVDEKRFLPEKQRNPPAGRGKVG